MAFCGKCGNQVADNTAFCPTCGAPMQAGGPSPVQTAPAAPVQPAPVQPAPAAPSFAAPAAPYTAPAAPMPGAQQPMTQPVYQQQPGMYQPPVMPGAAPGSPEADAQANKAMGVLAYIGILFLVPLFSAKDSPFARFHANQGLVLCIFEVGYFIVYMILSAILTALMFTSTAGFTIFGLLITLLGLLALIFPVFAIIGIVNAVGGKCKPLPVIGNIKLLK